MSSTAAEEIELLERVLFRLGCADTDDKLENAVGRFLTPVILKLSSPHENVRAKVLEVLTHIKKRITSRPQIKIPVEALLDQYTAAGSSAFLQNFSLIFITMGYPRLPIEEQSKLAAKVIGCEQKQEAYQDKLFLMLLPILAEINIPVDPAQRNEVLKLNDKPEVRCRFLELLQDVLLLPYGVTAEQDCPPGLSPYGFARIMTNNWKAEDLEKAKKGIVRFITTGIFVDHEIFILLVVAAADTRFSVATPALAELSKVSTVLDFTKPNITAPLYTVFSGNNKENERKTTPACARIRQKLLQYLIKCRGKGINPTQSIQVVFQGLYGEHTNQKCKVLALKFGENLIKDGPSTYISKVIKVIQTGIVKLIGRDSEEPLEVQNAAYTTLAQLARSYPDAINDDLKLIVACFQHLSTASPELHGSIRDALVAMAPAFTWKSQQKAKENETEKMEIEETTNDPTDIRLSGQQHLLFAMLCDNAESKLHIIQNATSVFLTTCYPEFYAPSRFLLLLIAGERNSLRENVTSHLYGVSKKDNVNYNMLSSIDYPETPVDDFNKLSSELRRVVLPSFKTIMKHVNEASTKRLNKNTAITVGRTKLPFSVEVYEEILDFLRVCLWYSAGIKSAPGDERYVNKLREYILKNYDDNDENNELLQYVRFVQRGVEAKRTESDLTCLYDLLNAAPELLASKQLHLCDPLTNSLKDVSETMRIRVSEVYSILLAYGFNEKDFDDQISECLAALPQRSLEHKHGWLLVLGNAFSRKIVLLQKQQKSKKNFAEWSQFVETIKVLAKILCETQWLLVSAAVKCFSMIGKTIEIPNIEVEIAIPSSKDDDEDDNELEEYKTATATTKLLIFGVIFALLRSTSVRAKIREEAAKCLGYLAVGDPKYFTQRNLEKFLSLVKGQKDAALNIAISEAIVATLNGYDVSSGPPSADFKNNQCDDAVFDKFLNSLIRLVNEPNPHARQSCSVWLLAVVKHCSQRPVILQRKQLLQMAFTELLSDDSELVQDVASRGLGLIYSLSDPNSQNDLANSLINQIIGGKNKVNKVADDTELFAEGMLGKTPTGGNITTYKELCSLASDCNQPEMVYQFMQLANHNAAWTSKLGAAFGFKALSKDAKVKMQPFLGKIIPRLYRYKYDPTPKIQNSMISIWDSVVSDSKAVIEQYYWEILRELIDNLTFNEWRVRIACCLAVRDLLKRQNGLRLRSEDRSSSKTTESNSAIASSSSSTNMDVDGVPEPELKELWWQLFRVMDDIHEGTRLSAEGTVVLLSKLCVIASSSDNGKSGTAVASSILPLLLETGVIHRVPEIRKVSIKTISDMIDSSGALIAPHLPSLIPCLLKATGELENTNLSYLSTRLGANEERQEAVDTIRAEAAKSHHTMETITKCVRFVDYTILEQTTPVVLELIKTSINLGTKIACAHFVCLISIRLSKEMTPLVGKYLGACFVGLKDRNATVKKYYASAIGHLVGIAKEQSIKNLFTKLDELYTENPANRAIPLSIQSINKRHHELLKDYLESVLPLVYYAMHEEQTEENKSNIEVWKDLWHEISPGDAGIRMNLNVIIPRLETALREPSWSRKTQAANAVENIATRLGTTIDESERLRLINLLLETLQGRTFQGKERLLQALAALCKGMKGHEVCERIVEAALRECRKEEPQYRTLVLGSMGTILEELEVDRFEEVYNMLWQLVEKKDLRKTPNSDDDDDNEGDKDLTADERNKRAQALSKLKVAVCETIGKSWPKNSLETQCKYQLQFAERCTRSLKDSTRPVQVSLLAALHKFIERLQIFEANAKPVNTVENQGKKPKFDELSTRDSIVKKISNDVLSAVTYAAGLPHTGLKKECLNIMLMLLKRLSEANDLTNLKLIKQSFDENLEKFQKDNAPEVRCRIKDIEEKFGKLKF